MRLLLSGADLSEVLASLVPLTVNPDVNKILLRCTKEVENCAEALSTEDSEPLEKALDRLLEVLRDFKLVDPRGELIGTERRASLEASSSKLALDLAISSIKTEMEVSIDDFLALIQDRTLTDYDDIRCCIAKIALFGNGEAAHAMRGLFCMSDEPHVRVLVLEQSKWLALRARRLLDQDKKDLVLTEVAQLRENGLADKEKAVRTAAFVAKWELAPSTDESMPDRHLVPPDPITEIATDALFLAINKVDYTSRGQQPRTKEAVDLAAVEAALNDGADVNAAYRRLSGEHGMSPLEFAIADGDLPLAKLLLARGAHLGAGCWGSSLPFESFRFHSGIDGREPIVKEVLEWIATNFEGYAAGLSQVELMLSAFVCACEGQYELFIKHADRIEDLTPYWDASGERFNLLDAALVGKNPKIVRYLRSKNVNPLNNTGLAEWVQAWHFPKNALELISMSRSDKELIELAGLKRYRD